MRSLLARMLVLPISALVFSYLELGGNYYAYKLLQRRTLYSIAGTLAFSVLYSLVAAFVARRLRLDMGLLMINYGFGFAIIAMLLKLDWGELPKLSLDLLRAHASVRGVLLVALVGFVWSGVTLIRASPAAEALDQRPPPIDQSP